MVFSFLIKITISLFAKHIVIAKYIIYNTVLYSALSKICYFLYSKYSTLRSGNSHCTYVTFRTILYNISFYSSYSMVQYFTYNRTQYSLLTERSTFYSTYNMARFLFYLLFCMTQTISTFNWFSIFLPKPVVLIFS